MKRKFECDEVCKSCGGTGLYVGLCEKDGAAVVCNRCLGSGMFHFTHEWEDFTGRKKKPKVRRVFQSSCGIIIGEIPEKHLTLEWFGGMPYGDWFDGEPFPKGSEMRNRVCPAWWWQSVDIRKKPQWDKCLACGAFSDCRHFPAKSSCWEKWDKEHPRG